MRSGLLAVGVILLVLGAIFYFVPTPASADTGVQEDSVTTTTYNTFGNDTNKTNTSGTQTVSDTTTSERVTTSQTTSSWSTMNVDRQLVADYQNDDVIYVFVDDNGDMYGENGQYLGEGLSSYDVTTTVSDTYAGSNAQNTQTVSQSGSGMQTSGTQTVSDTSGDTQTTNTAVGQNTAVENDNVAAGFNDPDTFGDAEDDGLDVGSVNDPDMFGDAQDDGLDAGTVFADDRENVNEAAGGVLASNWVRTLSILAMVLGAILTILGLVLPDRDHVHVDSRARTTSPAGRRVRYEREEERVRK